MRNRIGVIILTIIITGLSVFYLSFTFVARDIQDQANEYARTETGEIDYFKKQDYLDSIWEEPVYLGFPYKEVKENELNLGLDLQGGMHVTLEVSPVEILKGLAGSARTPEFDKALALAQERQMESQANFTDLFFEAFNEVAPNTRLATIFATSSNRGQINFDTEDEEVQQVIQSEVDGAIDRTFNIIRTRIDKFGVSQPNIQPVQGTSRIQIELPGVDNPQRIRKLLQGVAKLEFVQVYEPQDYVPYLYEVNDYLVKQKKAAAADLDSGLIAGEADATSDEALIAENDNELQLFDEDSTAADSAATDSTALAQQQQEVSELFTLAVQSANGLAYREQDTSAINDILNDPNVQALIPPNMHFVWEVKPASDQNGKSTGLLQLYAVQRGRGGQPPLSGDVIVDARQSFDEFGRPNISMSMNVEGAKKWRKLTGENIGKQVAIVLDNYVYSAPVVQGEIPNGQSSITGNFSIEEAQDLANVLKAGKLPASPRIVEEVVVGPSLGLEAQKEGIISITAGLVLVVVFMIVYYSKGGIVADIALLINILFIFGVLAQLSAALTLPGIAGIVLTIGMSIDANVLIFERIREELKRDSNILAAISQGYDRAFWTIFDSNVTTFLTGIFLYSFGSGPVKGFAVTLMIGIACSFFSAVFITRVIITWMTRKGKNSKINFVSPLSAKLLQNLDFKFLNKRKIAYTISGSLITIGLVVMLTNGLNLGVDFQGGRSYVVQFTEPMVPSDVEVSLKDGFENSAVEVKTFGGPQKLKITTNYLVTDESTEADSLVRTTLIQSLAGITGSSFQPSEELLSDGEFVILSTSKVGATIADDIADASRSAVIFSLIAIFFYIWVRFRNWRFGLGAVAALFHDALLLLSVFAIANLLGIAFEIDQVFVAAMLTVIGYSINDTVVVFDRVREYIGLKPSMEKNEKLISTLDQSLNSTMSRTLITSFTTLLVVLILFLFGGEVLRGFSFALLVGIMFGTYSSLFVATPIVYDTSSLRGGTQAGSAATGKKMKPA